MRSSLVITALAVLAGPGLMSRALAIETSDTRQVAVKVLAMDGLLSELQHKYPNISRWSATALPIKSADEIIAGRSVVNVKTLHMGARSAVRVSWVDDRATHQARTVWFDVAGMQSIVVASRDIPPSANLSAVDASIEERDVIGANCSTLQVVSDLAEMRSKRAIRNGAAICRDALEPKPAVARGESVTVRYLSDRVAITTKGIAQDDALIGQKIRITNPGSKDSFLAVVSAAREVLVHE